MRFYVKLLFAVLDRSRSEGEGRVLEMKLEFCAVGWEINLKNHWNIEKFARRGQAISLLILNNRKNA